MVLSTLGINGILPGAPLFIESEETLGARVLKWTEIRGCFVGVTKLLCSE